MLRFHQLINSPLAIGRNAIYSIEGREKIARLRKKCTKKLLIHPIGIKNIVLAVRFKFIKPFKKIQIAIILTLNLPIIVNINELNSLWFFQYYPNTINGYNMVIFY